RFDASAFEEMLSEFLTPQTRRALHDGLDRFVGAALDKDVIKDVLPCLGPDVGLCVTASADDAKSWLPNAVLALRVRPRETPPYATQSLSAALTGLAQAAVIDHNGKHAQRMTLKTQVQDRIEVKYLAGAAHLPAGLEPAFALKDGYLVVASSPDRIRRFEATAASPPAGRVPLRRISLKEVRRYVEARRPELAAALAEHGKSASKDVEKQLDELLLGLRAFDRLEVSQRTAEGLVALTLRVRMALPLKK